MKSIKLMAIAAIALPLAATPVAAKDMDRATFEKRAGKQFDKADLDSTGVLETADITAIVEAKEKRRAERRGGEPRRVNAKRIARYLEGIDTNENGTVEREEFVADRMVRFDKKDTNGNGVLEDSERGK